MDGVRAREDGDQTQRAALYTAGAMAGAPVWLASCAARRSRAPAPPVGFSYVGENTTWRAAAGFNSSADVAAQGRAGWRGAMTQVELTLSSHWARRVAPLSGARAAVRV